MTAEPIDYAAVQAEHEGHFAYNDGSCRPPTPGRTEPMIRHCLTYRLAVDAERLADKLARVEVFLRVSGGTSGRPPGAVSVVDLRAALADEPEVQS